MKPPVISSILLIDDDEISNLFNKIFISKLDLGISVDFALNGAEGLEIFKTPNSLTPNLLLLDIQMPIMNGWQFLEAYDKLVDEETKRNIIIVMLTTSEDEGDLIKAMNHPHINEFIKKPLSETKFDTLIKKYFTIEKEANF